MTNKIIVGDAKTVLSTLPEKSVNCIVTSPPYYGLRDYGVEGQMGLEPTPEAYVASLVDVLREAKRVLRDDGTLWLNLGDSYASSGGKSQPHRNNSGGFSGSDNNRTQPRALSGSVERPRSTSLVIKPKDLIGIPWRVAFALQADGWYLRQDIIWHKPNPMPESVTDRCTKAHEYMFLLSKSERYYFDHEAIKETAKRPEGSGNKKPRDIPGSLDLRLGKGLHLIGARALRQKRSVWTVATKSFKGAHFATFPQDLIEPCILAGCPVEGIVLDPFFGAGTTGLVAQKHGRQYLGIELNPAYAKIAFDRINPPRLF